MHQPSTAGRLKVQFFHPVLWSKLGALLVDGYEGATEERGDRKVPQEAGSYVKALRELKDDSLLDSTAWLNIRPLFERKERDAFKAATAQKKLAFDHVVDVLQDFDPTD